MTADVIVPVEGRAGCLTLNRPQASNGLMLDMVHALDAALLAWTDDPTIQVVMLDGAGARASWVGGDVRAWHPAAWIGDLSYPEAFFREEHCLNAYIACYPKPYVALMDDLVMDGGIGPSAHGAYRGVTERSWLAMLEASLGFLPDMDGTWLLGRIPGEFGTHAALTAGHMGAAEATLCGLADIYVPLGALPRLQDALAGCDTAEAAKEVLHAHSRAHAASPGRYEVQRSWIATWFAADSVEAILSALSDHADPAARSAAAGFAKCAPTSLKVTLRALRQAARLGRLASCLEQEFGFALAFMRQPDFVEGVRAALIDRDGSPLWQPAQHEDVSLGAVDRMFEANPGKHLALEDWLAPRRGSAWQ